VLLRLEALGKRYAHKDGPVDALRDISLDVAEGAFLTITGPSGSGKTTLLLAIGALLRPTSGRVLFRDREIQALPDAQRAEFRRAHVGFVMQNFSLIPYLSAARNVAVPLALRGLGAAEQQAQARRVLEEVGFGSRLHHLPRELSAGQQQRVAIARAMVAAPALILADEPTGNLDPALSRDILGLLRTVNEEKGITIVMVTHSPEAAARGDVRAHLVDGRLVGLEHGARQPQVSVATTESS
jgi:putative ABC transport system ATP-binding protein